ncbi:hypothetical protein [Actinomadura terrae]|uniref:hypothetical protein n=1 Tax=Actinomadura terrae TaxID=604353 RepID=UPI001FA72DB4|nr:hypothetical protein [Actinomadura terrae]
MDTYEGSARLEWWANTLTCLSSEGVRVVIVSDDSGWLASATFSPPLTAEEQEGWRFLMALSPAFLLRFDDDEDAEIEVHVEEASEGKLTLSVAGI